MKKPVLIHIFSTQRHEQGEEDHIDLTTVGTMYLQPASVYIVYEESELSGLAGTTTSIKVEGERVTVNRTGTVDVRQVFEAGVGSPCYYVTPFGTMGLEVLTSKVEADLTPEGGNITIEYELFQRERMDAPLGLGSGAKISDNRLQISVREEKVSECSRKYQGDPAARPAGGPDSSESGGGTGI